jgi:uncharacterized protein YcgL (UPF0745 family)
MIKHRRIETETRPIDEELTKLVTEDVDESKQSIEEAAYYLGMKRRQHDLPGDELKDWFEAENAVKENLD